MSRESLWRGVDDDTLKRLAKVSEKPMGATNGFLDAKRIACLLTGVRPELS
jgi:hypothetical protein